ncbi:MAG TPA: hypothetical protein VHE78_14535 [Gemmatimonadaceae bacterium]|nr:hypothetical protein [Gemmatimonadaceae bacterium]
MRIVYGLAFFLLATPGFAQLRPGRGNLQIRCATGYQVYVDGKLAGVCSTKTEGFLVSNLSPGDHIVEVRKSGYLPGKFAVMIQPGTTTELKVAALKLRRRIKYRAQEEPVDMTVASPPMFSDDTGTPGDRNAELNFIFDGDVSHDRKVYELPLLDFNYGIGENLQLKYQVPWVLERRIETDAAGNERRVSAHGISNSVAGVKYRFYDNDETKLSYAVYPQVEFRSPGSKSEEDGGVTASGTTWILPVLFTKEFDSFAVTGNAGLEISTGKSGSVFSSVGLGTRLTPRLALLGEIAGQDLNQADSRRLLLNLGLRKKLDDYQTIGVVLGHDFHAADGQKHSYFRVSYQRDFGEK